MFCLPEYKLSHTVESITQNKVLSLSRHCVHAESSYQISDLAYRRMKENAKILACLCKHDPQYDTASNSS